MNLTSKELNVIHDTDFLLTKAMVLDKIRMLFSEIQVNLKRQIEKLPADIIFTSPGKISRGENYQQLPYLVLDYPAHFSGKDIITFRTMFWWGHFYSTTLHLQGSYLQRFRNNIENNQFILAKRNVYFSTGDTPWEYHFKPNNYQLFTPETSIKLDKVDFLKLSQKFSLNSYKTLDTKVLEFYLLMMDLIRN